VPTGTVRLVIVSDQSATEPQADGHRPEREKDGFDCPRCGRWAHQLWTAAEFGREIKYRAKVGGNAYQHRSVWTASVCQRCQLPSVWRQDEMVYPQARLGATPHADMPEQVRELYEEASAVAAVSRRAGAALARCTVERLIKILDPEAPSNANLDTRISRLKPRITRSLGEMLDVVRVTGNGALHVDDQPGELVVMALDDEEGPQLLELLLQAANDLVEELVTRPSTTQGLWSKLPSGVRARMQTSSSVSGGSDDPPG
jgi:hypothetical protein